MSKKTAPVVKKAGQSSRILAGEDPVFPPMDDSEIAAWFIENAGLEIVGQEEDLDDEDILEIFYGHFQTLPPPVKKPASFFHKEGLLFWVPVRDIDTKYYDDDTVISRGSFLMQDTDMEGKCFVTPTHTTRVDPENRSRKIVVKCEEFSTYGALDIKLLTLYMDRSGFRDIVKTIFEKKDTSKSGVFNLAGPSNCISNLQKLREEAGYGSEQEIDEGDEEVIEDEALTALIRSKEEQNKASAPNVEEIADLVEKVEISPPEELPLEKDTETAEPPKEDPEVVEETSTPPVEEVTDELPPTEDTEEVPVPTPKKKIVKRVIRVKKTVAKESE